MPKREKPQWRENYEAMEQDAEIRARFASERRPPVSVDGEEPFDLFESAGTEPADPWEWF